MSASNTRRLQLALAALIIVSMIQAVWWYVDQSRYSARVVADKLEVLDADRDAAQILLNQGTSIQTVRDLFPSLDVRPEGVTIPADVRFAIKEERRRRVFMYGSEWTFFALVLMIGLAVIWRALEDQSKLRLHQENFLTLVSHEFKTPIASMALNIENMQRHPPSESALQDRLARLTSDLNRMQTMVSNVLESAGLQQGSMMLKGESVNVSDVINKALGNLAHEGKHLGLEIENKLPRDLRILADPLGCESVVRNLLGNALEAVRDTQNPKITVDFLEEEDAITVKFRDNGRGFAPEHQRRLFDKFYRADENYAGDRKGTGLGLYIVRQIMALEKGSVEASSGGTGMGAEFQVMWRKPAASRSAG